MRRYENLVTPKPDAVSEAELALSLLPVAFVLVWPRARTCIRHTTASRVHAWGRAMALRHRRTPV